jgi:hypothetical protein
MARPHKFSPKKFQVAQIKTLVFIIRLSRICTIDSANLKSVIAPLEPLRPVFKPVGPLSHRRLIHLLKTSPNLREALELKNVPHYSTLAKFEARWTR